MIPHAPDPEALKRHFLEALDLPPDDKASLLRDLARDDPPLHAALLALLRAHEEAGLFLSAPTHTPPAPPAEPEEQPGERVGPFLLLNRLGEGGFAVVWRASQEEPVRREVALKILKPGMDSRQVLARFDAERQTLAVLNHPSIARVLDAGTTPRARPYFAMQLVEGEPITSYCDRARLTVPERLRLFIAVCLAVQHAHQKGIIHRDLKPTNILVGPVDNRPLPVIIDFGIAKAIEGPLTEASALTEARQIVGTPQYMAPEQAGLGSGGIDTRTDVYSLGILLYELLTGVSPYDLERLRSAGYAEAARLVREARPSKPSTRFLTLGEGRTAIALSRKADEHALVRQLRGDLDWIVLRATEKDPESRYPTAYALARDVEHHLRDEPVSAGPPSRVYRLSKFIRRHRFAAASGLIAAIAVIIALVLALMSMQQANSMRDIAEDALDAANDRLWDSYLAQAMASRRGAKPGRRAAAIDAVRSAALIRPSLELRNQAVAALALDDAEFRPAERGEPTASAWGLRGAHRLLRADPAGSVRVVNTADESDLLRFEEPGLDPAFAAMSPDGSLVAVTLRAPDSFRVDVWSTVTRERLASFTGPRAFGFETRLGTPAAGPAWVAIAPTPEGISVYSLPAGETILTMPRSERRTSRLAATPDGRLLAATDPDDERVEVWSIERAERLHAIHMASPPISVAIDPSTSMLAVGLDDRSIVLLDPASGEIHRTLRGHQGLPVRLAFLERSPALVSHAWDNTIRFWDLDTAMPILGPIEGWQPANLADEFFATSDERAGFWRFSPSPVYDRLAVPAAFGVNSECAFLPGGRAFVTAGDSGVLLWDANSGRPTQSLTSLEANSVAILEHPPTIVAALDSGIVAWAFAPDQAGLSIGPARSLLPQEPAGDSWVAPLAGGDRVVAISRGSVHILDPGAPAVERTLPGYDGLAEKPCVSPDGRWLFTGSWRGESARVRDFDSGEQVLSIEASHAVARFSSTGDALYVGTPDRFVCYDVPSWRTRWSVDREWTDTLAGVVACDPNGAFLALGITRSKLRLVNPATGDEIATLEGPDLHELNDAFISPDGATIICTTVDRVVQRWRLDALRTRLREIHPDLDLFIDPP